MSKKKDIHGNRKSKDSLQARIDKGRRAFEKLRKQELKEFWKKRKRDD